MKPFLGIARDDGSAELHGPRVFRVAQTRIGGEVRLDDRASLARQLELDASTVDDLEIILHAWRRWNTRCIDFIHGDFSFVLRDDETGQWFAARDRLGVRPFYRARVAGMLLLSNLLETLLSHPAVDAETLDHGAVADYLANGISGDPEATIYANIRRLPPAHAFSWQGGDDPKMQRYWSLQLPEQRPRTDAPEQLEAALNDAIRDRLSGSSAVVFMSGGLDSTALAALAHELSPATRILAATSIYRTRVQDVEESFAAEAARSIGIPQRFFLLDEWTPLHSLESGLWTVEPGPLLTASMTRAIYAASAEHAPIALHGHPADAVLSADLNRFLRGLIRDRRFATLAAMLTNYTLHQRRPPWFFLRDLLGWPRRPASSVDPPGWLRDPPAERVLSEPPPHPVDSPMWATLFEWAHPSQTGAAIELMYPWCDLRVLGAALALVPFPWLVDKRVLREILRNRVSESVRTRPKTFLRGNPWSVPLSEVPAISIAEASHYIDPARFHEETARAGQLSDASLRAVVFSYWLRERPHRVAGLRVESGHDSQG